MNAHSPIGECLDMIIVGAGISGIGMAVHMQRDCPGKSFAILDRRERVGGTWDLFRYPGIRSDSDMHTLGFSFAPWKHEKSIADGPAILEYLDDITDRYGLRETMRFGQKVISAEWDSSTALWTVTTETADGTHQRLQGRFLFLGSGYYDYDDPYDAGFKGRDKFKGTIIHPQFWPKDFDHTGKKVVVIGSGATAVTIVPAMANSGAAHVTQLQRTPTYMVSRPARDAIANTLRKFLPEKLAYAITRFKNITMQDGLSYRIDFEENFGEFLPSTAVQAADLVLFLNSISLAGPIVENESRQLLPQLLDCYFAANPNDEIKAIIRRGLPLMNRLAAFAGLFQRWSRKGIRRIIILVDVLNGLK